MNALRQLIYAILYGFIRTVFAAVCGFLVGNGIIGEEAATFIDSAAGEVTTGLIGLVLILYFSYRNKIVEFAKTHLALILPSGTDYNDLIDNLKIVRSKKKAASGKVFLASLAIVVFLPGCQHFKAKAPSVETQYHLSLEIYVDVMSNVNREYKAGNIADDTYAKILEHAGRFRLVKNLCKAAINILDWETAKANLAVMNTELSAIQVYSKEREEVR